MDGVLQETTDACKLGVMTEDTELETDDAHTPKRKVRKGPKKPRKATPQYLERAALWYLERYAATTSSLRRVMERKVDRSAKVHGTDPNEGRQIIQDLIERYQRVGLLDDQQFAESRARNLHARGVSVRMIRGKLFQKGLSGDLIDAALEKLEEEVGDPNATAAISYARRRRLGPYRDPARREDMREKDLAALARAGFSYDTARWVVDAESIDDLEAAN